MNRHIPLKWNGVVRGWFDTGRSVYYRIADPGHFCVKYRGWGLQAEILRRLQEVGCRWVEIRLKRSGRILRAPLGTFAELGTKATLNPADGEQVFLPESKFQELRGRIP